MVNKQEKELLRETKKPRSRTSFTNWQLSALEAQFQIQQYLVGEARRNFAIRLNLTEAQVKVWLQNRRIRFRREQRMLANKMTINN